MAKVIEANYDVPHCKFERTDDGGFIVQYKGGTVLSTFVIPLLAVALFILTLIVWANSSGFLALIVFIGGVFGLYKFYPILAPPTKIQVTPDFVIIENKQMRRADFGHFIQYGSQAIPTGKTTTTLHMLGYQLGTQSYKIRGAWAQERQVSEVASALNTQLKNAPRRGDDLRASPEALRAARPTDF